MELTCFTLPAHQVRRLAAPVSVRTESGLLWITVDGEPEDILLAAGECRSFERRAALIVYALGGEARFQLRASVARGRVSGWRWGQRWASWWRAVLPVPRGHA